MIEPEDTSTVRLRPCRF